MIPHPPENINHAREFLNLFAVNRRSLIANTFCKAVRAGATDPAQIISSVKAEARKRLPAPRQAGIAGQHTHEDPRFVSLLFYLTVEPALALSYAVYILKREAAPAPEKEKFKTARSYYYRSEYLLNQPPTEKQLKFLLALGCKEEVTSKWEASQLIDRLRKGEI
jgi:hypothetical protein